MKKNKGFGLILIILAFFLFTSYVSAQDFQVPTPTPARDAGAESAPNINSPREACQYYDSRWERAMYIGAVTNTEDECLYKMDLGNGIEYIRVFYSENRNNLCVTDGGGKTSCKPVKRTNAVTTQPTKQPQSVQQIPEQTIPKIVTPPSFQIKQLQYLELPHGRPIQSGDNERIELLMPDGSIIQIDANSTFTPVSDYEVQSVFGRYRYMWQPFHDGKCIVGQSLARQNCRKVTTRDAILGVTGTEFLVDTDEAGTTVTVLEGSLSIADLNVKKTIEVVGGQFTYIKHGGLPDDPKSFDSTKIDRWWEKKTLEQNSMIYALMLFGLIILIVIPIQIKRRISAKKKLALKVEKK